jgi:hypothetical protein
MFRTNGKHLYMLEMEEFNSALLEDFVSTYDKTLLLLGDGIFVDAHRLKKKLGYKLYIQRILNMYQLQKTVEDLYYDDFAIFIVVRISELKEWKEEVMLNISKALENMSNRSERPNIFYVVGDEDFKPHWLEKTFRRKIAEAIKEWEEIPQALEWR